MLMSATYITQSKHLNGRFKGTCPSGVILSVRPIFHNLFLAQSCANVFTVPYSALRDNPSHIVDTDIDTDLLQGLEHRVKEIAAFLVQSILMKAIETDIFGE